jgi:hypothetical protein
MPFLSNISSCCSGTVKNCYSVAIKKPNSKECYYWDSFESTNEFQSGADINSWINKNFIKSGSKWENFIIYNDEIPIGYTNLSHQIYKGSSNGHCKGILVWNREKIGWLIHSVPKFPTLEPNIHLNETQSTQPLLLDISAGELEYGQSFIYYELDSSYLSQIMSQIVNMNAQIYMVKASPQDLEYIVKNNNTTVTEVILNIEKERTVFNKKSKITATHISKPHTAHIDIYEERISHLQDGSRVHILTETWIRGGETTASKYVTHLKGVKEWKETQDHSKWAILTPMEETRWMRWFHWKKPTYRVFVGDLNTMNSQEKRGGGGIMIDGNKDLWSCFNKLIN